MLGWLKKLKGAKSIQNAAGLPENLVKLLALDFEKLASVKSDLPERVLCYLLDVTDENVLSALRRSNGCGKALDMICHNCSSILDSDRETPRARFFEQAAIPDHEFFLRLAQVYDAASCSSPRSVDGRYLPAWVEVFLLEATRFTPHCFPPRYINTALGADVMERMLVAGGLEPDLLVRTALIPRQDDWGHSVPKLCSVLDGFGDSILRYPNVVHEALNQSDHKQRVYALELLNELRVPGGLFVNAIVDQAVSSSASVRRAAYLTVMRSPDVFVPLLNTKLTSGKPGERAQAARLLYSLLGDQARELLRQRMECETSTRVREEIEAILRSAENNDSNSTPPELALPPLEPVDPIAPLPDSAYSALKAILPAKFGRREFQMVQGLSKRSGSYEECHESRVNVDCREHEQVCKRAMEFVRIPDVRLIHVFRLLVLLGWVWRDRHIPSTTYSFDDCVREFGKFHGCRVSLRDMALVYSAVGLDPDGIGWRRLHGYWHCYVWDADLTWPYFAERPHILQQVLDSQSNILKFEAYEMPEVRRRAFEVLAMFPQIPGQLVAALWDVALGESKTESPLAKKCLENVSDKETVLTQALKNSKQAARAAAATWLAELGATSAVPAIKTALAKEKQDLARVAMMNALETLGVPLDDFLNLEQLTNDAENGLGKGVPSSLDWFPFDQLPAVRWRQNGLEVPSSVVKWWICQHCKLNSPEPGALIIRHCSLLRQEDREALGSFILDAWISQDTKPTYTREQAERLARQQAPQWASYYPNRSADSLFRLCLKSLLDECQGSAIKEKGILALVAACGGSKLVPMAERYVRRWYGLRAAQCKALIRMLGWIEDKSATQLLLAIATRFRTKGIQEEADRCVKALAERNGWTSDELADRTIPTAGFDDGPELLLDYGNRTFTATLDRDHKLVLKNENGEVINSLPESRVSDDAEMVKATKDRMSLVRKELKSVLKVQKQRLYEAMCTQRTWRFEDWDVYLNRHPIARHYCQSLVWVACEDKQAERRFRPLDDGTLTDHGDEEVKLTPDAIVRVAHSLNTPECERAAWLQHYRDYEVAPLFDQFTKPVYSLPENLREESELIDFRGHMIEAFKLRNRALSLGYTRGKAQDKGYFYEYIKRLPGIGLEAIIEFSGNQLPEENVTVALCGLWFRKVFVDNGYWSMRVRHELLGDVPGVLLGECWNDMRIIAGEGTGFDKDWETKVG